MKKRLAPSFDNPWFVTVLYVALTVAATWPLAKVMTTDIAWDLGDPVLNCWIMMWTGGQLLRFLKGDVSALADYWNGNIFYPERLTIAYSEHLTPQMLQILPVYAVTGNMVLCYNLLFLSTIVLCGLGMYLLIRELTGQPIAAFVAGVAFALSPYRVDQFAHLQVMSSQWMPLALYGFRRYFTGGRTRALVGATSALVVQVLSCGYYLFFFVPFAAAYCLYEIAAQNLWRQRRVWVQLSIASAVSLMVIAPFLTPYLKVRSVAGMGVRDLSEVASYSADTWAMATASENLTFWGPRLQTFQRAEGNGFPGLTILVIGLIGLAVVIGRAIVHARRSAPPRGFSWRTIVAVLFVVLSAALVGGWIWLLVWGGGVLRGDGWRITVRGFEMIQNRTLIVILMAIALLPGFRRFLRGVPNSAGGYFAVGWVMAMILALGPIVSVHGKTIGIGPYAYLYDYIPGFNGMRVPARFFMVATLCLTALGGIGLAAVLTRWKKAGLALALVAVCGIFAESAVTPFITNKRLWVDHFELEPRHLAPRRAMGAVYETLRDLPGDVVLAEFPYGSPPFDIQSMFYAGYHRKKLLNGYSGFFPRSFNARIASLGGDPRDRAEAWLTLMQSGATHVVVHEAAYYDDKGENISAWLRASGAREIARNDRDRLFALK
jgi:hypothetical protein